MTLQDVSTLLDFHYWARDRMLDAVERLTPEQYTRAIGGSFASVRDTVVHTYGADWIWYMRWTGTSPTAGPRFEDHPDVTTVAAAWSELEGRVRAFLGPQDDATLARPCEYRLLNGTEARSPLWQLIQHVVNHGSYHRGQVATLLRQLGAAPPRSTDLITFYRERSG